jgi:uncharacterized protein (DUF2147 family)
LFQARLKERWRAGANSTKWRNALCVSGLAVCLAACPAMAAEPSLLGRWARGDGKARVRVEPCGGVYCAISTWIKPGTSGEKVGDKLVMNVALSGRSVMKGQAWDPQRSMTYRMTIQLGSNTLTTRGCVIGGLVCKTMNWRRTAI